MGGSHHLSWECRLQEYHHGNSTEVTPGSHGSHGKFCQKYPWCASWVQPTKSYPWLQVSIIMSYRRSILLAHRRFFDENALESVTILVYWTAPAYFTWLGHGYQIPPVPKLERLCITCLSSPRNFATDWSNTHTRVCPFFNIIPTMIRKRTVQYFVHRSVYQKAFHLYVRAIVRISRNEWTCSELISTRRFLWL